MKRKVLIVLFGLSVLLLSVISYKVFTILNYDPYKVYEPTNFISIAREKKKCKEKGGELKISNGSWCTNYLDAGKTCKSNEDCMSNKCVLGTITRTQDYFQSDENFLKYKQYDSILGKEILPENITGECSIDDRSAYFSKEIRIIIKDSQRYADLPPVSGSYL